MTQTITSLKLNSHCQFFQTCIRTVCRESILFPSLVCCRWEMKVGSISPNCSLNVLTSYVFLAVVLSNTSAWFWNRLPQKEPTLCRETLLPVKKNLFLFSIFFFKTTHYESTFESPVFWRSALVSPMLRQRWTTCLTKWLLSKTTVGFSHVRSTLVVSLYHMFDSCTVFGYLPTVTRPRVLNVHNRKVRLNKACGTIADCTFEELCDRVGPTLSDIACTQRTSTCTSYLVYCGRNNEMVKYF